MALPWLALIKAVPWKDVVEHAPAVLSGAKKLWQRQPTGSGKLSGQGRSAGAGGLAGEADDGPASAARVAELEAQLAEALGQLSITNQLLQDMAEQQARMLAQIEANRQALGRLRWLAVVAVALAAAAALQAFAG